MKVVIGLVIIVVIVVVVVPLSTVTDYEYEPYQTQEPLSYREIESGAYRDDDVWLGAVVRCEVTIENTDKVSGTFVVDFTVNTSDSKYTDSDSADILPGEVKTLTGLADIFWDDDWNWSRTITPETKPVTQYHRKAYQKKVSILDYLLNY